IWFQTVGTAPNREFIVEFNAIPEFCCTGSPSTFEYKLFEGSNLVEVHYPLAQSGGHQHSAGIENETGTVGNQFFLGTGSLPPNTAVRYTPSTGAGVSSLSVGTTAK